MHNKFIKICININTINFLKIKLKSYEFIKIVPIIILVITFCLTEWLPISSLGMVMFWGILLIALHNVIVTNNLLNILTDKK